MLLKDFADEFTKYRTSAEKAISQISDDGLNRILAPNGNSVAMIVRHVGGNLVSRFTDFLTTDGEKPWRDRESEFFEGPFTRAEIVELWNNGFGALDAALGSLSDDDLARTVTIRGAPLTVHEALCRSLAHTASHVGQIILLARIVAMNEWQWISIPKGRSAQYNANPTLEKGPAR
ncbi:MAG TPA: DUF1572 family protein [Gemmatimonadaceae bacterium]|nr:DUF1572 family protein [Gemmatimonadaceae bacterium]